MKIIWNQTLFGFALNPRTAAATGALTKRAACTGDTGEKYNQADQKSLMEADISQE